MVLLEVTLSVPLTFSSHRMESLPFFGLVFCHLFFFLTFCNVEDKSICIQYLFKTLSATLNAEFGHVTGLLFYVSVTEMY